MYSVGVNTPDHAVMFANLAAMLTERVTSLVATLHAKDCSTVKALLSKLLSQLLSHPELVTRLLSILLLFHLYIVLNLCACIHAWIVMVNWALRTSF